MITICIISFILGVMFRRYRRFPDSTALAFQKILEVASSCLELFLSGHGRDSGIVELSITGHILVGAPFAMIELLGRPTPSKHPDPRVVCWSGS